MTAPTGVRSGVGFRHAVLFALNSAGTPAATAPATTAYAGVHLSGAKVLTINDPEPRRISHVGDDSLITIDMLPPVEGISGELRTGKLDDAVDALLTGQIAFTVGEAKLFGVGTDKRGYEAQVGMLAYRQAQDTSPTSATFGQRVWDFRIMPKVVLFTRESGYADTPEEHVYTVVPMKCGAHLWGTAFAVGTEGFTQGQILRGVTNGKPKIVSWLADGTEDEFLFPVTEPATGTGTIVVWKNGTIVSTGMTPTTTKLTFTAPPTAADRIVAFYEVA